MKRPPSLSPFEHTQSPAVHPNIFRHASDGFSLLEVLITVGIIVVLTSVLLPQTNKLMEGGRETKCLGKLRAIGTAFGTYSAENGGMIPCVMVKANGGTNPSGGNWLMELSPYLSPTGAITHNDNMREYSVCPTFQRKYGNESTWADWKGGYGMNYRLLRPAGDDDTRSAKERLRLVAIPAHSQNILAGDCGPSVGLESNTDGTFVVNAASNTGYTGAHPDRHRGRANYVFVDGHCEMLTPEGAGEYLKKRN